MPYVVNGQLVSTPMPRAMTFRPQAGPVGTKVLIWGSNLLSKRASPSSDFEVHALRQCQ